MESYKSTSIPRSLNIEAAGNNIYTSSSLDLRGESGGHQVEEAEKKRRRRNGVVIIISLWCLLSKQPLSL